MERNSLNYKIGLNYTTQLAMCNESSSFSEVPREEETVRIELDAQKLSTLLEKQILCVSDFRCLDCTSKHRVRELCLKTCLGCLRQR